MQLTLPDGSSLRELMAWAERTLMHGPHPERARMDAETLLLHVLQQEAPERNRAWLITHGDVLGPCAITGPYAALIVRRSAGEPIQYIIGEAEFYGLPFRVTRDVLIPRPETEHSVEKVIELAARFESARMVDVGTGSGAIAVALAHALPKAQITATDFSEAALHVARENATRNGVAERIRFLHGSLLEPVARERFDIVVSNPPYVPEADRHTLSAEVREYEPSLALFAGADGLDVYRRFIPAALDVLDPGGLIVLEIGFGQARAIESLLSASGFAAVSFTRDLQQILRVACAQKP